ncbi:MAG TPA: di-heme oxidoredictase family protein [Thermoanaerobaculia bacterium]|jgi:CxxC motif-containing protein (DUF1111 family)
MGSRASFRIAAIAVLALSPLAFTSDTNVGAPNFGEPLAGLTPDQLERFNQGKAEFTEVETVEEGLGPIFNDSSCANCHNLAAVGGGGTVLETRFGKMRSDGTFDPMSEFGGSLIQRFGIGVAGDCDYLEEAVPPEATVRADRRTTALFGLGLVDAVPDSTFYALAALERAFPDHTAGTVSVVTNISTGRPAVGKFGWKCQNPTIFQFSGDAYVNEMGITNPQFPTENCPAGDCDSLSCNPDPAMNDDGEGVAAFADFMTMLAPPPRGPVTGQVLLGNATFLAIGCANCHTPLMQTGSSPIAALNKKYFAPYSDFLLHDMGSLGDGITQNLATGKLMRTAPLWGVRKQLPLLHDGRAASLNDAILAHAGQGQKSRDRYAGLPQSQKNNVIAFLNSL